MVWLPLRAFNSPLASRSSSAKFMLPYRIDLSFVRGWRLQLRASESGLSNALSAWRVEVASVQLGNEPSSVVAVAGLSDSNLQHFERVSTACAESVASFQKRRSEMLNFLFLARGAARYERDPTVALSYVDKAKEAAKAARADLASIASESGVELKQQPPKRADSAAPEDTLKFTPRSAPKVENKLVF